MTDRGQGSGVRKDRSAEIRTLNPALNRCSTANRLQTTAFLTAKYANHAKRAKRSSPDRVIASEARQSSDLHRFTPSESVKSAAPPPLFFLACFARSCHNRPQRNFLDEAATNELEPFVGRTDVVRSK